MWHWYAVIGMGGDMGKREHTRIICSGHKLEQKELCEDLDTLAKEHFCTSAFIHRSVKKE